MHRTFNIAILECDTPSNNVSQIHGSYGEMIERLILKGFEQSVDDLTGISLRFTKWDVVQTQIYPDPEQIDAIALTGSKHTAFNHDPWITSLTTYIHDVLTHHHTTTKIIGICFGHQIIARAAGAEVGKSPGGWEMSVNKITLSETGAKLFGQPELTLHQMHRDAVLTIPGGYINLGQSPRCSIQGLYMPKKALSLQAHPEFNEDVISKIINRRHQEGIFSDEVTQDGLARANGECDDGVCAKVFYQFLVQG